MEVTSRTRIIVGLTFAAYSLITILLGIWSTRQARKTDTFGSGFGKNFYAGGGNMNWLLVGMMLAAGGASGGTFLSNPGLAHSWGLMWCICMFGTIFLNLYGAGLVQKKLKIVCGRINAVSFGVVLKHRFNNNRFIAWYTPFSIVVFTGLMLYMQMTSGAKLVATMTGMRYEIGLVLFGIILVVYTIFGGAKGTSIVSVFQGFIMTVTTVALMVGLFTYVRSDYGTVEKAFRSLALTDPSILTPTAQFSLTGLMSYLFLTGMSGAVGSNNVSRAVQIGSSKALHRSTIMTILFIGFWSCIMPFLGTLGKTVFPDIASDTIIPYAALMVLPPVFAGIVVAGVTSAIHSTLAVNMLTVNASVVMDLYGSLIKPEATDKELQKVNTISTAALIVLMTLFAIKPPALIGVINNFAIAGGAAAFFIPMLLGTWWKRANEYGCIASMVGGVGYYFLATFNPVFAFNMNPIIPSLIVALLAMVIVSVATPAPEKEIVDIWFGADYGTRAANHS